MPHKRTDSNQAKIVKDLRKKGYWLWLTHMVGHGFPDIIVLDKKLRLNLFEIKTDVGKLNELENKFWLTYRGRGATIRTADEAIAYMED